MRIGTWNVEYASPGRLAAQNDVLRANPASIWVLTETRDALSPAECAYSAHSKPRPKNGNTKVKDDSRWVSIWSASPVEQIFVEGADDERTVIGIVDLDAGGRILVYGTVLPWHTDSGKSGHEKNWSEHYRVIPEQHKEWRELRQRYPDAALCVAGDYNTQMVGSDRLPGYRYGTKQGDAALENALVDCELFCATSPSHMPPELLEERPIDHIALPLDWQGRAKVIAAWPKCKGVSDHSGLIVSTEH